MVLTAIALIVAALGRVPSDGAARAAGPVARATPAIPDRRTRLYKTNLREAQGGKPDFARDHVLVLIGRGAGCVEVAAVRRGRRGVAWLPGNVTGWPADMLEPVVYRIDSNVLVVHGLIGERGGVGPHRFVLERGRFRALPSAR